MHWPLSAVALIAAVLPTVSPPSAAEMAERTDAIPRCSPPPSIDVAVAAENQLSVPAADVANGARRVAVSYPISQCEEAAHG